MNKKPYIPPQSQIISHSSTLMAASGPDPDSQNDPQIGNTLDLDLEE